MNDNLVSAVFDSQTEAERAVAQLRVAGVDDSAISLIARNEGRTTTTDGAASPRSPSPASARSSPLVRLPARPSLARR
jgi:predicted N-acetyltransferase YhbS